MDFYVILGVTPQATTAEIKRAYRRLARRYHPGVNPGDRTAEALFRRISEAYETLADPVRRRQYDAVGRRVETGAIPSLRFAEFDFSAAAQGAQAATFTEMFAELLHPVPPRDDRPEQGADVHAAVSLTLEESLRGGTREVLVTRQVQCGICRGAGQTAARGGRCPNCQGTGQIRWARGHMVFTKGCPSCAGTGELQVVRCGGCGGQGRVVRTESVSVPIPPGVSSGTTLRVPHKGHAGRLGGATGDLYVSVSVQPHAVFRRDGDDLVATLPVAVHEAVLGARVEAPSLDGAVRLRIPPGTQAGQRLRVRERGAPRPDGTRGDLVFEVKVVLPSVVDERSKELIREFGRRNAEDVRSAWLAAATQSG